MIKLQEVTGNYKTLQRATQSKMICYIDIKIDAFLHVWSCYYNIFLNVILTYIVY